MVRPLREGESGHRENTVLEQKKILFIRNFCISA